MNAFYGSFRLKMTLLCAVVLFVIIAAVHASMYFMTTKIVAEQISHHSQSVAVIVAHHIMEDIDAYKRFIETKDVTSEYYRRMQDFLAKIKEGSNKLIRFIYTERPAGADTVEFLLDAEPIGSDGYSAPGDTTFMDEASKAVYATGLPAPLQLTESPFGTLLGGCAPIFDADGSMLGLVGVNTDATEMLDSINTLQMTMLLVYATILTVSLLLITKYSSAILEPIVKDKLTGAYAKRYYDKIVHKEIRNVAKRGEDLALLMLDLDHFKNINDTYGHDFGDRVLATVSKAIMSCLRPDDYFIRYGGEEFAVVVPNVRIEAALKIAERIRVTVGETEIYNEKEDKEVRMTISIGVSHLNSQYRSSKLLMELADKALYDAKGTRNAVSLSE